MRPESAARRRYLTIEEAAATLRVSERTVRRWIARGNLDAQKVGGTVRIANAAVGTGRRTPRPRRGRPPSGPGISASALSDEAFARTWDNPEDAVYDRWRQIYRVRAR